MSIPEIKPATVSLSSPFKLGSGLDLQAGTLCGKKLRGQNLQRYLDVCAPFGSEDLEWICLHYLECVKIDDDYWLEDEYVLENFTTNRELEDRYWDGRWCFGNFEPKEQVHKSPSR